MKSTVSISAEITKAKHSHTEKQTTPADTNQAPTTPSRQTRLKQLPSVQQVVRWLAEQALPHGKVMLPLIRDTLNNFRAEIINNPHLTSYSREQWLEKTAVAIQRHQNNGLQPVINASGVVIHTNLGRAPLPAGLIADCAPLLAGYLNLEWDIHTGSRGRRGGQAEALLAQLAGTQAALITNNNAAALLLLLTTFAKDKEVIISRGELVEIGGGFRVPEILELSGAKLVEVGATNRTRLADYAQAITANTAALLKVHSANFTMQGYVEETPCSQLVSLAKQHQIACWHDLGSGNFYRFEQPALAALPTVKQSTKSGVDVLTFSGDKLLGLPQAGIMVGEKKSIEQMKQHPLYRSLRMDRLRLVLLERGLEAYLMPQQLAQQNPTIGMLERTPETMRPMATKLLQHLQPLKAKGLSAELQEDYSAAGGGAAPQINIPTLCIALIDQYRSAAALAEALRQQTPPVLTRLQQDRVLIDLRTVFIHELTLIATQLGLVMETEASPS